MMGGERRTANGRPSLRLPRRLLHRLQILLAERLLAGRELAEVDALRARVLARRQELRGDVGAERLRAHRPQIRVRPQLLAFVGQHEIEHLPAVRLVRRALHEAHHVRHRNRAFLRNHEFDVRMILVLRAIGVEIVVEQDRNLAGQHARVCGLLRHDRLVRLQLAEPVERRAEIVEAAAERLVHRDGARIADERARRIEIADHPLVLGLEQIGPRARHRLAVERVLVDEEAERAGVDREPVALRVLEIRRDVAPVRGLVGGDDALVLRLERRGHAEIDDVRDGALLLGDQLRDRLARVLVVERHANAGPLLDRGDLRGPVGPFGRAVVADRGVLRVRGGCAERQRERRDGDQHGGARATHGGERRARKKRTADGHGGSP
ncbi:hypothetical protein DO65_5953 [Burkholderia pseudomallei]|nr:hypothetical protein DO65_5953 [Burkholderia pseudomallei]